MPLQTKVEPFCAQGARHKAVPAIEKGSSVDSVPQRQKETFFGLTLTEP